MLSVTPYPVSYSGTQVNIIGGAANTAEILESLQHHDVETSNTYPHFDTGDFIVVFKENKKKNHFTKDIRGVEKGLVLKL